MGSRRIVLYGKGSLRRQKDQVKEISFALTRVEESGSRKPNLGDYVSEVASLRDACGELEMKEEQ